MTSTGERPRGLFGERYDIVGELGRGGMGIVYACIDRVTNQRVALKRVERKGRQGATGETIWFHQEARALASLDHPAIVRARDFGTSTDSTPYLVMDFVSGTSLQTLLESGSQPWPMTWITIDQVLGALAHAHARGVIHGDLKPQNIIIAPAPSLGADPRVYILDFGLAFLLRDRHDSRLDGIAQPGPELPYGGGTAGFMAPEQIRRAVPHVGPPTDLYALGCILFQLLTGHMPYEATKEGPNGLQMDEEALLRMHKSSPVPRPTLPPGVPEEVASLCVRLLAKRPWRRFEFAADVRTIWERFRPLEPMTERNLDVDRAPFAGLEEQLMTNPPTSTPDTALDDIGQSALQEEPVVTPHGAPELLGLRPVPLVGRHHERNEMNRLLELTGKDPSTRHRMVLLSGEAGVGKSRLAEWFCEQAHENGKMIPLRARYRRMNGPLDGLNGAILSHYGLERVDRILIEQALINVWEIDKDDAEGMTWVAATAEWLRPSNFEEHPIGQSGETSAKANESSLVRDRRKAPRSPLGPTGRRFTLDEPELRWLVIRRIFERIGRERPVLLWLDDLHLAPPMTFEGLDKIRREATSLKWMIVATTRSEAVGSDLAIARRIDRLCRSFGGVRVHLPPLDATETRTLLRTTLPLEERALREAERKSKGNPLFALQLLHAWAARDGLELLGSHYRVRDDVLYGRASTTSELWDERLLLLEASHRLAAEAAAALGVECRGDVLRRLLGFTVGLGGFGADVARALNALQRAHILVATGEDRFRFPHVLLQEHLLLRLASRSNAKVTFQAAAGALASHPLANTRRVVRHRVLNLLRAGESDAAAKLLIELIEHSWSRVRDASRTLDDLALLDGPRVDVGAKPPPLSAEWTAQHARWRGEALRHAGRFEDARHAAQQARKSFISLGDERSEGHCLRLLGHIASEQGGPVEGYKLVAQALAIFDRHDDEAGRASCEIVMGEIDYLLGNHVAARDALQRGARRFLALGDILGRAQCLVLTGLIELAQGNLTRSRELLAEAREEFDNMGYRLGLAQCDVALAHAEHRAGDFQNAKHRASAARDTLKVLENPRGTAAAERLLSMLALDTDAYSESEEHAQLALDLYEKLGDPWGVLESKLLLTQRALAVHQLDVAKKYYDECDLMDVNEAEPQQHRHLTRAWLHAAHHHFVEASHAISAAQRVFTDPRRMGDHSVLLLQKFIALDWPDPAHTLVREWLSTLGASRGKTSPRSQ